MSRDDEPRYDGVWHVFPNHDLREHVTDGSPCWCDPKDEDGIVTHNALDEREKFETGERKPS